MAASTALRQAVETTAPRRPWCGAVKNAARVRPLATALELPYVQLNPPAAWTWLQFDLDYSDSAHAWEDAYLPPPTYVAINPENGHAQYGYRLAVPVCTSPAGRDAPKLYLAAVQHAYGQALHADPGFRGPLAKNPLNSAWVLWQPAANAPAYELGALAEYAELPAPAALLARTPDTIYGELGRNCKVFETVRALAYPLVRDYWRPGGFDAYAERVGQIAAAAGGQFTPPLPDSEIRGIARSVARWVWRKFTPTQFRAVQAARGRLHGAARRRALLPTARQLSCRGHSVRAIAQELGVPRKTVSDWLARAEE